MHCCGVAKGTTFLLIIATGPVTGQSASTQVYKSAGDDGETVYSDNPINRESGTGRGCPVATHG